MTRGNGARQSGQVSEEPFEELAPQARLLSGFWLIPGTLEGVSLEEQPHPPRLLGCLPAPPSPGTFPQLSKAPGPSSCALRATSGLVGEEGDSRGGMRISRKQPWVGVGALLTCDGWAS